jgi:hypothetical protein
VEINLLDFDMANFAQLGGGAVVQQVANLLKQATKDMEKRPADGRARVISVKIKLVPITRLEPLDERTNRTVLDGAQASVEMDLKVPSRSTTTYDLGISTNGLVFNPDSPHNHRQAGLPFTIDGDVREVVPLHG